MDQRKHEKSLFWGIALIAAGGLLLLSNLDFWNFELRHYLFRWESILIFFGLLVLLVRRNIIGGLAMVAIGSYFLMDDLFFLSEEWRIWFWPVLLLLAGVGMVLTRNRNRCC